MTQSLRWGVFRTIFTVVFGVAFGSSNAWAFTPPTFSDSVLAEHPVIVVGRWNKAPTRVHEKIEGNVRTRLEVHTELVVEKVIKGDVKPGTHPIILHAFVGWPNEDGGPLMSFTSNEMMGDVEDVKDSNLWFLSLGRSWDEADDGQYLRLENHRSVQPLRFEDYYRAMISEKPHEEVAKLLIVEDPDIAVRVLKHLCGEVTPWPYYHSFFNDNIEKARSWQPLGQYRSEVEKLFDREQPRVRRLAVAAYLDLARTMSVPRMRSLLADPDPEIRAIAAGALVRYVDEISYDRIVPALGGLNNPTIAARIIELLATWQAPHAVPALIEFLQTEGFADGRMSASHVPAVMASILLRSKTGHDFPFDVEASRAAWEQVKSIDDPDALTARLKEILPTDAHPFIAVLTTVNGEPWMIVTNHSSRSVVIAKQPDDFRFSWAEGESLIGNGAAMNAEDFITVKLKESFRFALPKQKLRETLLLSATVQFLQNGSRQGVKAWIGTIVARPPQD